MEDDKIIVIVPIPLLDMMEYFEIFKIHNIPFPSVKVNKMGISATGKYLLEAPVIAVDTRRSKFGLLTREEGQICTNSLGFCYINSPIYPLNENRFCVIALFKNNCWGHLVCFQGEKGKCKNQALSPKGKTTIIFNIKRKKITHSIAFH